MKSIFTYPYRWRYYLTHPWKFIIDTFNILRDLFHRARYGWTYSDVWNFNSWFLEIIPDMLEYLATHSCGYPGDEEFPEYENWQAWLRRQAIAIRNCSEEGQEKRNEYKAEYDAALDQCRIASKPDPDNSHLKIMYFENEPENMKEITEKYYARAQELAEEANDTLEVAMIELAHKMPTLWD